VHHLGLVGARRSTRGCWRAGASSTAVPCSLHEHKAASLHTRMPSVLRIKSAGAVSLPRRPVTGIEPRALARQQAARGCACWRNCAFLADGSSRLENTSNSVESWERTETLCHYLMILQPSFIHLTVQQSPCSGSKAPTSVRGAGARGVGLGAAWEQQRRFPPVRAIGHAACAHELLGGLCAPVPPAAPAASFG
jgi:hypothetical protein